MKRKNITFIMISVLAFGALSSCVSSGDDPGIEYAPNMYNSEAMEAYTQINDNSYNDGGMNMRMPVKGTIAVGQLDYAMYEEGYEASDAWTNPTPASEENLAKGEILYNRFCSHCHGTTGKNDGAVVAKSEYPMPPFEGYSADYIKNLSDGKIFHTITFGKNMMGPHGSLLTPEERWKVVHYVRKLSLGDAFIYSDEVAEVAADTAAVDVEDTP